MSSNDTTARRSPRGASCAYDDLLVDASERLADTPVTGGRAHDVLAGLRRLEERMAAEKAIRPTKRTSVAAEVKAVRAARPLWRKILSWTVNGVIVATIVYFWPARFGGATNTVLVRGTSMLPMYEVNDFVFVRAQDEYEVGDVVLFEIPEGKAQGMQIIHRIIGRHEDGTWLTQGDNRPTPDQFHLADENLLGTPVLHIPEAGRVLQLMRNTFVISGAVGIGAVLLMWPSSPKAADGEQDDDVDGEDRAPAGAPPSEPDVPAFVVVMPGDTGDAAPVPDTVLTDLAHRSAGTIAAVRRAAWNDAQQAERPTTVGAWDDDALDAFLDDLALEGLTPDGGHDVDGRSDADAEAERWLAEELAALGIDL